MNIRVGQGIDIHQLVDGRKLILGGIEIPSEKGLLGHSDADVLLHAVIDAILGATGKGDIGQQFPNTDKTWKDAASLDLLSRIWVPIKSEGWRVQNLDCSVLLESPKIAKFIPQMKANIAKILEVESGAIGIKATTSESMGFVGRGEGALAQAVVLLSRS
jgi:2-C-methyl-D-erythritol 2,4-cyclodiphosphate synthase